ncbi:hypothetical protein P153DRAFT_386478 [Dothidotthia symphoricarpi CBS 119687]|uniref:Uncharacterized protein n=1 Tax=Dothidotthia symphoricarpi CBS 119687 TaxID=1392245 RepID=A0A6A6AB26_9PLEO|nr:uncharacterized protein P153DRAFT_386478 [Dothidotthia symphoricarpi CBS 119687]KAF2128355.1 hypothetical protein P153DRAFT_386478 [Dothidotthia symphoricarpi CBS 119687]
MDAPSHGHASASDISPLLRQRMLNRPATFAEGVQHSPSAPSARRSSLLSNFSDTRHSFRSSTEDLKFRGNNDMDKFTSSDEPTHWSSAPVVFAVLPAVGGLLYQGGGPILTDLLTLLLAGWFLNWCVRSPWNWYHAAQQRHYIDSSGVQYNDSIPEEDEDSTGGFDERTEPAAKVSGEPEVDESTGAPPVTDAQKDACEELKRQELVSFVACFVGPLVGAYLMHTIRAQLTRADSLISDYNLTIFILMAEIRPVGRLIKMIEERTLRLQRIVRSDPRDEWKPADAQAISQRLAELEAKSNGPAKSSDVDIMTISAEVRQSMQPQLDALNRAVRRYEKRHMAQSLQIEARFQEIDVRLKDTLSLAAAAARTGQRPGLVATAISWIASAVNFGMQTTWDLAMYPPRTAISMITSIKSTVSGRQPRKREKGQLNGYSSSISTPRMQSKSGR